MITVDPAHPSGPAEQIRAQVTALIQSGELAADAKLPPVRQLAGDLRVAAGTVAKAYKELEAAGLVRTGRANGTRVNPGQVVDAPALKEVKRLVAAARRAGMSLEDVQGIVAVSWNA
jgi:GntR family transcriptional regulator